MCPTLVAGIYRSALSLPQPSATCAVERRVSRYLGSDKLGLVVCVSVPVIVYGESRGWSVNNDCCAGLVQTRARCRGLRPFRLLRSRSMHKSWLGWQFHRVHHSENAVDVTTAFRQHPGETVWRVLWQLAAIVLFGLPLSVVIVYLLLSTLNAQLEHSNIKMNGSLERCLRLLIVTPHMHKVHHSRKQKQTDSNYSNIFSIWDRVFRTYTSEVDFQSLRYGLDGFDVKERQTLNGLLKMPFMTYKRV